MKAIYEDTQEYEALCERYGEKPETDSVGANPYGEHARSLKERARKERETTTNRK